jgi:hypothetical protein
MLHQQLREPEMNLRLLLLASALVLGGAMGAPPAPKVPPKLSYFSIETGSSTGSNFTAGSTIATILSHPPGSVRCRAKTACGPEGMIALTLSAQGALAAARDVALHRVESALVPANIAAAAFEGRDEAGARGPYQDLRAIARLYPEVLQLVAAKGRGVKSLADLKRRTVAIDDDETATHSAALAVLEAANVSGTALKLTSADPERAAELLVARRIDAFFVLAPVPSPILTRLAAQIAIDLVPLSAGTIKNLDKNIYTSEMIAASTYKGVPAVRTVSVGMLWIVTASADEALIDQLTAALWDEANTGFFARQGLGGRNFADALTGLPLPLHPGAERYYRERGALTAAARDKRANLLPARAPNR